MTQRELKVLLTQGLGVILIVVAILSLPTLIVVTLESGNWYDGRIHWVWNGVANGWRAPAYLLLVALRIVVLALLGAYFLKRGARMQESA